VKNSKELRIRCAARFDAEDREPLQVRINRRIRNSLNEYIPKSMGFSQSLSTVLAGGDII
jgi:hypothetical protein